MEVKLVYLNKEIICDDVLFVNKKETWENWLERENKYIILYVTKDYEIKKKILTLKYTYKDQFVSWYKYNHMTPEQKKEARPFLDNNEYISTEILIENDAEDFISDALGLNNSRIKYSFAERKEYKKKYSFTGSIHINPNSFFKKRNHNNNIDRASKHKYNEYFYYSDVINYKKWLEESIAQSIDSKLDKEIALRPLSAIKKLGQHRWLNTLGEIACGSYNNIEEIENLINKRFAKLCSHTFELEDKDVFVSKEIDPYIASRKFQLQIVRSPETPQKAFDYIKVEFTVITKTDIKWLKTNYKPIAKKAIQFIENNKQFRKFDVPSNILKLENITLSRDKIAIFTFGIKELSSTMQ